MIMPMSKVRVLGPRGRLGDILAVLQDFGLLHLADAPHDVPLDTVPLSARQQRMRRQLERLVDDAGAAEAALGRLDAAPAGPPRPGPDAPARATLPRAARAAFHARRDAERLAARRHALDDERTVIAKYRELYAAFEAPLARVARVPGLSTLALVVPRREANAIGTIADALRQRIGDEVTITSHVLRDGDTALLLVLPSALASRTEPVLAGARLAEIRVPDAYAGRPLAEAVPLMLARLDEVERELEDIHGRARALADVTRPALRAALGAAHDCLAELDAIARCAATAHAVAVDGWAPSTAVPDLGRRLGEAFGGAVEVHVLAREQWAAERAPVVLSNPRLFRPFERVVRVMPLPAYGSIDPTPFVAVFFPMMFGMILGDVGYGIMLAVLGMFLRRHAAPGSIRRDVADIATACAAFTIIFGALFGELFGTLGAQWLGVHPPIDREQAMVAMLAIAVGLGVVHVVLGLVLGAIAAWRHERRHAVGRGVTAIMVLLVVLALLAALEILPRALFTPFVIATLVAFPVLVIAEGILAPVELLSTMGNVLSYARIMALGTASVMMAATANRLAGMMGSAVVGVAFALLFHLVNFGIGLFSPTLQVLRLHYVEFFQKFYSPGGQQFRPFAHWRATAGG